jgi:hypothetical protein
MPRGYTLNVAYRPKGTGREIRPAHLLLVGLAAAAAASMTPLSSPIRGFAGVRMRCRSWRGFRRPHLSPAERRLPVCVAVRLLAACQSANAMQARACSCSPPSCSHESFGLCGPKVTRFWAPGGPMLLLGLGWLLSDSSAADDPTGRSDPKKQEKAIQRPPCGRRIF